MGEGKRGAARHDKDGRVALILSSVLDMRA